MTMIEDRGEAYVSRWVQEIPKKFNLTAEYIADGLLNARVIDWETFEVVRTQLLAGDTAQTVALVGALTGPQAKEVIVALRRVDLRLAPAQPTRCSGCGLPLGRSGECEECV